MSSDFHDIGLRRAVSRLLTDSRHYLSKIWAIQPRWRRWWDTVRTHA